MNILEELDEQFPNCRAPEREDEWQSVKLRLPIGHPVAGTVVHKSPFGAWVDPGMGFPALLEIVVIAGLTPEKYRAGDWCPIGCEISGFVCGYHDHSRQIGIRQTPFADGQP